MCSISQHFELLISKGGENITFLIALYCNQACSEPTPKKKGMQYGSEKICRTYISLQTNRVLCIYN